MGAQGVQFRGIDAVLQVYDNLKVQAWSITYGKNINMKFVGETWEESREALHVFLQQLEASCTNAVYTLNLYEDLKGKATQIKLSTEPDYSFNFVVFSNENPNGLYAQRNTATNQLLEKVTRLEAQLAIKDSEEDDEEEDDNSIGAILGSIFDFKDPQLKEWIRQKAIGFADKFFSGNAAPPPPANIIPMQTSGAAKIGGVSAEDPVLIDKAEQELMQHALEILARIDPKLGTNLMKIAKIAEGTPDKYNTFVNML
jgi:hypothetical protein